jgi:hypothetical protein
LLFRASGKPDARQPRRAGAEVPTLWEEEPVNIMNVLIMVRGLGAAALITIVLIGATGACLCRA